MENNTNNTKASEPVPVIACGATFATGEKVVALIKPEFEVIHFINSVQDAKSDLGELIAGRGPKNSKPNHIGTHDYSKPPRAVMFGRAFPPDEVKELNRVFRGAGPAPVAWIAADPAHPPPNPLPADYADKAADNMKRSFARWENAGGDSEDIVYY